MPYSPVKPNIKCPACECNYMVLEEDYTHGYSIRCGKCGRFIKWTGKGKGKRDNNAGHKLGMKLQGKLTCEICGMTEEEAGKAGITMHLDHINPLSVSGDDTLVNKRPLCALCHAVKTAIEGYTRVMRRCSSL